MSEITEKLVKKVIEKRKRLGFSLRKLSQLTEVSFSTLSRLENGLGSPDNSTFIRLINWLGPDEADQLGFKISKCASVHFRAKKNIKSETVKALIEVVDIIKRNTKKT